MTATEISKELNLPLATVKQRLRRAGIKPFCQEALYTRADMEKIKVAPMGRPPKKDKGKPAPEPARPPAPKAKGKK